MNIPARYISLNHFIDHIEDDVSFYAEDLVECGVKDESIIALFDNAFPLLLPATHTHRWTLLDHEAKMFIIGQMTDWDFQWKPTADDLALVEPEWLDDHLVRNFTIPEHIRAQRVNFIDL